MPSGVIRVFSGFSAWEEFLREKIGVSSITQKITKYKITSIIIIDFANIRTYKNSVDPKRSTGNNYWHIPDGIKINLVNIILNTVKSKPT